MLGDVNISAILDSFSVSYDKRVRPNYGGEYTLIHALLTHRLRATTFPLGEILPVHLKAVLKKFESSMFSVELVSFIGLYIFIVISCIQNTEDYS